MIRLIKENVKVFIGIIISLLIGSVGIYAYTYQADNIEYGKYGSTSVENAINALYSKVSDRPKVQIGDIVYMVPTSTSYTITPSMTGMDSYSGSTSPQSTIKTNGQTINPSLMKYWRVININSDGTIEAVSEYAQNATNGTPIYFYGITGFQKFIGTLNTIAKQYANSSYTVEGGFRHFGYNGQTEYVTRKPSKGSWPSKITPWLETTIGGSLGAEYENGYGGDTLYLRDLQLLWNARKKKNASITEADAIKAYKIDASGNPTTTITSYWLAFRWFGCYDGAYSECSNSGEWRGGEFYSSYGTNTRCLFDVDGDSFNVGDPIRPVITLKSGLTYTEATNNQYADWIVS